MLLFCFFLMVFFSFVSLFIIGGKKVSKLDKGKGKRDVADEEKKSRKKPKQQLATVRNVVKEVRVNCRPGKVVDLLDNLSVAQKKDVADIGFGGLFLFKMTNIPLGIVPWLIEKFEFA